MAFVAITASSVTLQGKSGKLYNLAFTKAAAVGMVTFTQDGQTFFQLPEQCRIIDAYVGDAVNATDYFDIYVNSQVRPQLRIYSDGVNNATTVPRLTPSSWIGAGAQFAVYHYSA